MGDILANSNYNNKQKTTGDYKETRYGVNNLM